MSSHYGGSQYASSHHLSNHYGRVVTEIPPDFTPEPVYPPGMGPEERLRHRRILQEDEIIMALIVAFLNMKDK